jgi:hypothetical protein
MTRTAEAPRRTAPAQTGKTEMLSTYLCDANARLAHEHQIDFKWLSENPQHDVTLPSGAGKAFDQFVLTARQRSNPSSPIEIRFREDGQTVTASAGYFLALGDEAARGDFALSDPAWGELKALFTLEVERYAYWEEARLTLRLAPSVDIG